MVKKRSAGFTLIELLVVISIIALLMAILMPALNKAKELAAQIPCMTNNRTLAIAFFMYQADNNGKLINAYTWLGNPEFTDAWVHPPTDVKLGEPYYNSGVNLYDQAECTIEREINGIKIGKLWTYIANEKTYHCPGDNRSKINNVGYRTYSMINTIRDPHDGNVRGVHEVTKMGEILTPGSKYIFVEAQRMRNGKYHWNMGAWCYSIPAENFNEAPARAHNNAVVLGFADGHADKYKWKSKAMKDWLEMDPLPTHAPANVKGTEDALYFLRHIPRGDIR